MTFVVRWPLNVNELTINWAISWSSVKEEGKEGDILQIKEIKLFASGNMCMPQFASQKDKQQLFLERGQQTALDTWSNTTLVS